MEVTKLVNAAKQKDLEAFNQLVLKYQNSAYYLACYLLQNHESAADIIQEAFILAYLKLYQFKGNSFRAWLLRIVTNLCYDELRAFKRHPTQPLETFDPYGMPGEIQDGIRDASLLPEETVEVNELHTLLKKELWKLPVKYRHAVDLIDIQELSYKEAAFVMQVSVGTLKSRLARGRNRLRNSLFALRSNTGLLPNRRSCLIQKR